MTNNWITPVGECEYTGKHKYRSQRDCQQVCDWANKQNTIKGNQVRVKPEYCNECGYWHTTHIKQIKQESTMDNFLDITPEQMIDKLQSLGYWVVTPDRVETVVRRLKFVKELLEAERKAAKGE